MAKFLRIKSARIWQC